MDNLWCSRLVFQQGLLPDHMWGWKCLAVPNDRFWARGYAACCHRLGEKQQLTLSDALFIFTLARALARVEVISRLINRWMLQPKFQCHKRDAVWDVVSLSHLGHFSYCERSCISCHSVIIKSSPGPPPSQWEGHIRCGHWQCGWLNNEGGPDCDIWLFLWLNEDYSRPL